MTTLPFFVARDPRKPPRHALQAVRLFVGLCLALNARATYPVSSQSTSTSIPSADEAYFLKENEGAMGKMMAGMAIRPSGDVDRDFVNMMAPHHQGAIDMAMAILRYGHNEKVRRLAQEIIVDQQQEILAMRRAVGEALPPSQAAPTSPSRGETPEPTPDRSGM
jgi:hypothetical protein